MRTHDNTHWYWRLVVVRRSAPVRSRGRARLLLLAALSAPVSLNYSGGPAKALASEYWVSPASCSDGGSGAPPFSSYCTISAALAAHHAPGTVIHVLPGVYREQVTVS